jgi:hypothetical protein
VSIYLEHDLGDTDEASDGGESEGGGDEGGGEEGRNSGRS